MQFVSTKLSLLKLEFNPRPICFRNGKYGGAVSPASRLWQQPSRNFPLRQFSTRNDINSVYSAIFDGDIGHLKTVPDNSKSIKTCEEDVGRLF